MTSKLSRLSLIFATVLLLFAGCRKDKYDEDMLIGSWNTGTWSYIFHEDHSGSRTQGPATQNFTWTLSDDELELRITQYDESTTNITTFVTFVIESLTSSKMEVYDKQGSSKDIITFRK